MDYSIKLSLSITIRYRYNKCNKNHEIHRNNACFYLFHSVLTENCRFSLHFLPRIFTIDKTANFSFTEGWYNEVINSLFLRQQSTHFHHSILLFIHLLYLPKKETLL